MFLFIIYIFIYLYVYIFSVSYSQFFPKLTVSDRSSKPIWSHFVCRPCVCEYTCSFHLICHVHVLLFQEGHALTFCYFFVCVNHKYDFQLLPKLTDQASLSDHILFVVCLHDFIAFTQADRSGPMAIKRRRAHFWSQPPFSTIYS